MIYNAEQSQTDRLLSTFKRDDRIEKKLEKIKIFYRSKENRKREEENVDLLLHLNRR